MLKGKKFSSVFVVFLLIWGSLRVWGQTLGSSDEKEILRAGDAVRIQIWQIWARPGDQSAVGNLSGDYYIRSDGTILMPFVGKVQVAGRTPEEAALIIREKYKAYLREPFILVRPLIRVVLRGAFVRPGAYRVDPESSLWEVIALAGGPANEANLQRMRVVRGGKVVIENLLESFEKGYSLKDIGIQSGDIIAAPRRGTGLTMNRLISYLSFATSVALLYIRLKERW